MFERVIFKETLVFMCLAIVFGTSASLKKSVGHRDIYYAKKMLNNFACLEFRILVEN